MARQKKYPERINQLRKMMNVANDCDRLADKFERFLWHLEKQQKYILSCLKGPEASAERAANAMGNYHSLIHEAAAIAKVYGTYEIDVRAVQDFCERIGIDTQAFQARVDAIPIHIACKEADARKVRTVKMLIAECVRTKEELSLWFQLS